jgi:uncharacterized Zn finger protein
VTDLAGPFLAMFESLRMGPTFARGRRDARAGHVRNLTISSSLVVAQVRGPDETVAQRARIAVRAFGAAEWARVEGDLATQARYVADLLAGRMPAEIDKVFTAAGLSLLPLSIGEVAMDCSCERWPMPCAHLAATCYTLARSFETDPFGVFAWRGRGRDELLLHLRQLRGAVLQRADAGPEPPPPAGLGEIADFWGTTLAPAALTAARAARARPDLLLDQLDPPPAAVGGAVLVEVLRPAYLLMRREGS